MHPTILELQAARVVYTPHGDQRLLHLKAQARCVKKEVSADVLGDNSAQDSLVWNRSFRDEFLKPCRILVRLKVANAENVGEGTHEAIICLEFGERDRWKQPGLSKWILLYGNFYAPGYFWSRYYSGVW